MWQASIWEISVSEICYVTYCIEKSDLAAMWQASIWEISVSEICYGTYCIEKPSAHSAPLILQFWRRISAEQ